MSWAVVADVAAGACLIGGAFLAFAAGVGVVRFPDLLSRMHAGTKPQVLGLILVLIGLSLRLRSGSAVWALVLVAAFQMLTAPVAAHMVGRAGYRTGKVRHDLLVVDELTSAQQRADSDRADSDRADSDRADSDKAALDRAESDRADPDRGTDPDRGSAGER